MRNVSRTKREIPLELEMELAALRRRSFWRWLLDTLFGFDFFVSYRWSDGKQYAVRLAAALKQRGYECFLDSQTYSAGDDWKVAGAAAIRRTSELLVVGSPGVVESDPVLREVQIFSHRGRKIIPISFDGSLDSERIRGYPIDRFITSALLKIEEPIAALNNGPTNAALDKLQKAFHSRRQSQKRLYALQTFSAVLVVLLLGTLSLAWYAQRQQAIAEARQLAAESRLNADVNSAVSLSMAVKSVRRFRTEDGLVTLDAALSLPQARFRLDHGGPVNSVVFSPDGSRLLTSSDDMTARIWEVETGKMLARLMGHRARVRTAMFSPDGSRIVTASDDETARVWDVRSGHLLGTLVAAKRGIRSASFLFDNQRIGLIVGGGFQLWERVEGTWHLSRDVGARASVLSEDGRRVLFAGDDMAGVADLVNQQGIPLGEQSRDFRLGVFSQRAKRVLTTTVDKPKSEPFPRDVTCVWDAESGRLLSTLLGHPFVMTAAFSPDGKNIVTGGDFDGLGRIWNAETGSSNATLVGHHERILSATFSPGGERVLTASGDHTARLWDVETGRSIAVFTGHGAPVRAAVFSPDGKRVATISEDNTARIWEFERGRAQMLFRDTLPLDSAVFSPDATRILTSGDPPKLYDAVSGRLMARLTGQKGHQIAFSRDGTRILIEDVNAVVVWDVAMGRVLFALTGHGHGLSSAAFSPDGTRIVTASFDKTARIWDVATGKVLSVLGEHTGSVNSALFSPDGTRVLTLSEDKTARIWTVSSGRQLAVLRGLGEKVTSAAFSGNGNRIVTSSGDAVARVWDSRSGELLLSLRGHREQIWTAVFSPDDQRVVTASNDQTARVWDAISGNLLVTLVGHRAPVMAARFSPDSRWVVTASEDRTARVWDAATGHMLRTLGHDDVVNMASFSPDGKRVLTASDDHTARVFAVDPDDMVNAAMTLLHGRR